MSNSLLGRGHGSGAQTVDIYHRSEPSPSIGLGIKSSTATEAVLKPFLKNERVEVRLVYPAPISSPIRNQIYGCASVSVGNTDDAIKHWATAAGRGRIARPR